MNQTLPTGRCATEWCDQGDRPHTRHEVTAITVFGEGWTERGPVSVQIVIHGYDDHDAVPMLAIVDSRGRQVDAVLDWPGLHEVACAMIEQDRAHARRTQGE